MKKLFLFVSSVVLLSAFSAKADYVKKGAFICKSSELLNEMTSIAVKIADAKNAGNESKANDYWEQLASLMMNNQCSITDKNYKASMIDSGFSKHKIRVYYEGTNMAVWTAVEDYVRE